MLKGKKAAKIKGLMEKGDLGAGRDDVQTELRRECPKL